MIYYQMPQKNSPAKKSVVESAKLVPPEKTTIVPKRTASPAAGTKAVRPAKVTPPKDKLGSRLGSQAERINSQLSNKPQTLAALAKATGLKPTRVRSHLQILCTNGHATSTSEGFVLIARK